MAKHWMVPLLILPILLFSAVSVASEVLLWDYVPWRVDYYQQYADEYMKENPDTNIRVELISYGQYLTKIQVSIAAGSPPTMFSFHPSYISAFQGALQPFPKDLFDYKALSEQLLGFSNLISQDGNLYYYPLGVQGPVLFVNNSLWSAAGLAKTPRTWEEAKALGKRTTQSSPDGTTQVAGLYFADDLTFLITDLMYQYGGSFYKNGGTELGLADEPGMKAARYANELYQTGMSGQNGKSVKFRNGQATMRYGWAWRGQTYRQVEDLDWSAAPLPTLTGDLKPGMSRMTYYLGMAAPVGGDPQATREAFEFIHWAYTNEDKLLDLNRKSGTLPVRKSLWNRSAIMEDPVLSTLTQTLPFAKFPGETPSWIWTELNAVRNAIWSSNDNPVIKLQDTVEVINARLKDEPVSLVAD